MKVSSILSTKETQLNTFKLKIKENKDWLEIMYEIRLETNHGIQGAMLTAIKKNYYLQERLKK